VSGFRCFSLSYVFLRCLCLPSLFCTTTITHHPPLSFFHALSPHQGLSPPSGPVASILGPPLISSQPTVMASLRPRQQYESVNSQSQVSLLSAQSPSPPNRVQAAFSQTPSAVSSYTDLSAVSSFISANRSAHLIVFQDERYHGTTGKGQMIPQSISDKVCLLLRDSSFSELIIIFCPLRSNPSFPSRRIPMNGVQTFLSTIARTMTSFTTQTLGGITRTIKGVAYSLSVVPPTLVA
jgi:hypothetical protein